MKDLTLEELKDLRIGNIINRGGHVYCLEARDLSKVYECIAENRIEMLNYKGILINDSKGVHLQPGQSLPWLICTMVSGDFKNHTYSYYMNGEVGIEYIHEMQNAAYHLGEDEVNFEINRDSV